ncbi:MAG: N-acetyl-gamma-glutamyl-phosphate reductase [Pseudomonadota bacterium]
MIRAGIVGGTGYTGVELLRLLLAHADVEIAAITSRAKAGRAVADLFPNLRGLTALEFVSPDDADLEACDVVFYATPHNVAMHTVPALLDAGVRVIDLSADFRLRDVATWEEWYREKHACPDRVADAIYGLPEMYRADIRGAQLVACPGCYPTAVQLGFFPLLAAGAVDTQNLIANAASGVSGAGRQARLDSLLTEAGDNFKAYAVSGHRHLPEITQGLSAMAGVDVGLTFVPHLAPMIRGIHATLYARLQKAVNVQELFERHYADEPFVDVLPAGDYPQTRSVRGANTLQVAVTQPRGSETVVVTAVEDNLVKGASGQAVQAMNIMLGLDEVAGLTGAGLLP